MMALLAHRIAGVLLGEKPKLTLVRVLIWPLLILMLTHYLLLPVRVTGISMFPTYRDGSINVINRTAYLHGGPKRGDVVALRSGSEVWFKRIVGLPHETISTESGLILIDGRPLIEHSHRTKLNDSIPPITLGARQYFFIGDNRRISEFGIVPEEKVLGKALF